MRPMPYIALAAGCLYFTVIGWNAYTEFREAQHLQHQAELDRAELNRLLQELAALEVGTATWYEKGLPDPSVPTCASRYWPRGTRLAVSHGGHTAIFPVTDFGPTVQSGHLIDLSRGAWEQLGVPLDRGVIQVTVREAQ